MPRKQRPVQRVKDLDDILHLLTGKRIPELIKGAYDLFGKPGAQRIVVDRILQDVKGSPYSVLELHDGASWPIVQAAHKTLARRYHPDSGTEKNEEMMKKVNVAYDEIKKIHKGAR